MKKSNNRLTWTIILYVIFVSTITINLLVLPEGIGAGLDIIAFILFGLFMVVRMDKLDNPKKPIKCCMGMHKTQITFDGWRMMGTNQYLNGHEIEKKKWKTEFKCTRPNCDHWTIN